MSSSKSYALTSDHRGGALTSFTLANVLLKPHPRALVAFNCLLNTGNWNGGLHEGKKALNHYLYTWAAYVFYIHT